MNADEITTPKKKSIGFFDMPFVNKISKLRDFDNAIALVHERILARTNKKTKINSINKAKIAVNKAEDIKTLVFTLSNFVLAHPSENLAVIKD